MIWIFLYLLFFNCSRFSKFLLFVVFPNEKAAENCRQKVKAIKKVLISIEKMNCSKAFPIDAQLNVEKKIRFFFFGFELPEINTKLNQSNIDYLLSE